MYLLFIDESGTPELKKTTTPDGNSLFFVLGAAFIHVKELERLEVKLQAIKKQFFKDIFTEIKYSIRAEKLISGMSISSFRETVYKCISEANITFFGVQQNKHFCWKEGLITSKDDTYLMSFQHLISLVNSHMFRKRIKDPITVFIDAMDDSHDLKVYKAYKYALENESLFKNFDKSRFSPSINFVKSKFTLGLQVADLVAGALWRGLETGDKSYSSTLKKSFPSSDNGNPLGYGYKVCTDWIAKK